MTQPLISVIVPVYNLEGYLERTAERLMEQTYRNLEIILIDDGSTDATSVICDSLAQQDPRFVVFHTENQGVSAARNMGLKAARGEYIGFCDGDDLPEKDLFEYLYQLISEADADISVCGVRICYEDRRRPDHLRGCSEVFTSPQEAIRKLIKTEISVSLYTKLFKADLIKDLFLPQEIRLREDEYYSFVAFSRAKRIVSGKQAKYVYIRRSGSASITAFSEKYYDILKVCERLEDEIGSMFPALKPELAAKGLKELMHVYSLMILCSSKQQYKTEKDALFRQIRGGNWKAVLKYMSRNDKIRFYMIQCSRSLYHLFIRMCSRG